MLANATMKQCFYNIILTKIFLCEIFKLYGRSTNAKSGELEVTPPPSETTDVDAGLPPEISSATLDAGATSEDQPKTLEEAQRQTEAAWSKVMDQMEEDVENNGWYFAKFGAKFGGGTDTRALVLKEPDEIEGVRHWLVVTRSGLITMAPEDPKKGNQRVDRILKENLIQLYEAGSVRFDSLGGYSGNQEIELRVDREAGSSDHMTLKPESYRENLSSSISIEWAQRVIKNSVDKAVHGQSFKIQNEIKETQEARNLSGFIQNLPPRP